MQQKLDFKDDRLFVGNTYYLNKFDQLYDFLLVEHAIDLFTPSELLAKIKSELRQKTSLVYLTRKRYFKIFK